MSVIGSINGIPVYSTTMEAVVFASQFGLKGYHHHTIKGVNGYMGGINHEDISRAMGAGVSHFLPKRILDKGQYITSSSILRDYRLNQESTRPSLTPRQLAQQPMTARSETANIDPETGLPWYIGGDYSGLAEAMAQAAAMPPNSPTTGIVFYGTNSATYTFTPDPDLGIYQDILLFDGQGNLFNVGYVTGDPITGGPIEPNYSIVKYAAINQMLGGNTTGFANGVTVTNIPAPGTY